MKNTLKIGQSFHVVEVLQSGVDKYIEKRFKKGGHTIMLGFNKCIMNGESAFSFGGINTLYLSDNDVKLIGKLTITKLK